MKLNIIALAVLLLTSTSLLAADGKDCCGKSCKHITKNVNSKECCNKAKNCKHITKIKMCYMTSTASAIPFAVPCNRVNVAIPTTASPMDIIEARGNGEDAMAQLRNNPNITFVRRY